MCPNDYLSAQSGELTRFRGLRNQKDTADGKEKRVMPTKAFAGCHIFNKLQPARTPGLFHFVPKNRLVGVLSPYAMQNRFPPEADVTARSALRDGNGPKGNPWPKGTLQIRVRGAGRQPH